jgi:hypothetical protein
MFPFLPKSKTTAVTNEVNDIEEQHRNYYTQGHVLHPSYVSEKVGVNKYDTRVRKMGLYITTNNPKFTPKMRRRKGRSGETSKEL